MEGIYTLANDKVYDQLVALLNSIEANCGDVAVCVIPYNENLDLVKQEINQRKNVFLFENQDSLKKWDSFVSHFYEIYYQYPHQGLTTKDTQKVPHSRKYCAFDGDFKKFVFIDCDTLLFQPLDHVFSKLDQYDFVVHDFQRISSLRRKDVNKYYKIFQTIYGSEDALALRFHCSGFWASKQGLISKEDLDYFLQELSNGDVKIFGHWLSEQMVLNYMTLKKNFRFYNFTLDEESAYNTGVCITSKHFEEKDKILYDGSKELTYLHYMGIKNERLEKLCQWKKRNIPYNELLLYLADKLFKWQLRSVPYRDIFLYYRFLNKHQKA